MKLSHALTLLGAGAGALGIGLATQGCSSSSSTSTGPSTSTGTVPPAAPTGPTTSVSATHAYAIHTLYLGDQSTSGVSSATAWEGFGYNLDGLETTASDTNVCTLYAGAAKSTQQDGPGGVDNSFGENIVPILITVAGANAAQTINTSIDGGSFTVIFAVTGWDDSNASQTATGLSGVLLAGTKFSGTPLFTVADQHWPIDDSLVTPSMPGTDPIKNANIKFDNAYVVDGEFVNGSPSTVTISLSIGGQTLGLNVNEASITWKNNGVGSINGGQIAGVLSTADLVSSLMSIAGHISTSLCSGSAFQSIATQLDQASDILSDGTNVAGKACDGISIGLGFEAKEIAYPVAADVVNPPMGSANPCDTDGGTADGG